MGKVSRNQPCPCGSGQKFKRCCDAVHRGRVPSPPELMRARFSAFAIGNAEYLIATTHPEGPQAQPDVEQWRADLEAYCHAVEFRELQVHGHDVDEIAGRATVTFTAALMRDGEDIGFTERSLFLLEGERWLYHSGTFEG